MIRFICNHTDVAVNMPPGMLLLDFLRYHHHLTGTKTGCNEGDCGACTVLVGELQHDEVMYRSVTSCLTPLGNVHGKHVITIEGLNSEGLHPIQQAMYEESATQCGFCTPGFVMSLAGCCMNTKKPTLQRVLASIDGNICRCTGYKSIERAAARLVQQVPFEFPVLHGINNRLQALSLEPNGALKAVDHAEWLGGGTDVYVQRHEGIKEASIRFLFNEKGLKGITQKGNRCVVGAATTVTEFAESPLMQEYFPRLQAHMKLVSSTPIRNIATIGGNIINASPIGDLTVFLLALNALLVFTNGQQRRELPLRQFYKGYKELDKQPGEWLETILFELPPYGTLFNFEKVSKRTHLDIATVNTAFYMTINKGLIEEVRLSAGGVAPIPKLLEKTNAFLNGRPVQETVIEEAIQIAQTEVVPISDVRGSAEYKRLLLGRLIKAHFITTGTLV